MLDSNGLEQIYENMFGGVMKKEEGVELRRQEFIKTFPDPKVFHNEYYVFSVLVKDYQKLQLSKDFVKTFMKANRAILEKSPNIDLSKYQLSDLEPFEEFLSSVLLMHDELQKVTVTKEAFLESLEMYKMHYITEQSLTILEEGARILTEGIRVRGKEKVGYVDMSTHVKTGLIKIDELTTNRERKGIITYGVNDMDDESTERDKLKVISPYGIPSLDAHTKGGIYEGEMVSILAPAKGGKSRFATYILHNAVVNGTNILMWSIENGYKGWEALIRARHFDFLYNQNADSVAQRKWVDDDMIRKNILDPELKDMELASWMDLRSNTSYGKITSLDEDFDADSFIEILDNAITMTDAKLICVDYLQLIQGSGRSSKQERIAEAYQKMLQFLKLKRIAGIFPGQIKQNAISQLNNTDDDEISSAELRDAAGESYEVIKTPDVNLLLFSKPEEQMQGRVKLVSIPSRNHSRFEAIPMNVSFGSCTFTEAK